MTKWNTKLVAEEMKKENCILIDEYSNGNFRIKYTYEDKEYSVRWFDWVRKDRPSRPHLNGGNRNTQPHKKWNNQNVNELLQKDDCELADQYRSTKQRFRYKYNNSYYWTTLDDWIHHKSRPHLYIITCEQRFREFLEENHYEFQTQYTFDDLKSEKNYKLRFDFYLVEFNLLVEIDDRSHLEVKDQIANGKLKNQYCIDHKLKLLRIDQSVEKNDFQKAIESIKESDIYILQYGKIYRNYNGIYKDEISQTN